MGKVIVIASGKGGTGKTMFAANLAATLSLAGKQVVAMDVDTGLRNLDLYLGLESSVVYDVQDVLNGVCRIKQALIKDRSFPGLYLMAASPKRPDGETTPLHMKVLCRKLATRFDYVIVDAPAGIDDGLALAAGGADMAILVVTPDFASSRDAEAVHQLLTDMGIRTIAFVVNLVNMDLVQRGYTSVMPEALQGYSQELIGVIQTDENIQISTNLGVPIVFMQDTYIAENFRKIATRVTELAART